MASEYKIRIRRNSMTRGFVAAVLCLLLFADVATAVAQPRANHDHKTSTGRTPAATSKNSSADTAQPAATLQLTYKDGLFYLSTQNAPLVEVLEQFQRYTGATIITPAGLKQTVTLRLDAASPAQVLVAVLQGLNLDYVIASSPSDSAQIATVILTLRNSQLEPYVAAKPNLPEEPPVETRAQALANLTGGDEGGTDSVEVGTPVLIAPTVAPSPNPQLPK